MNMKPTSLQIKMIELCEGQLAFWKGTNDISSPTHFCDLESDLDTFSLDNNISLDNLNDISIALESLFKAIKKLN